MTSISLNKDTESIYQKIVTSFGDAPFEKGHLFIARAGNDELEIYVKNDAGVKLPIGRKGTGVQQILIILAYLASSNATILGIEEMEINLSPHSQMEIYQTIIDLISAKNVPFYIDEHRFILID